MLHHKLVPILLITFLVAAVAFFIFGDLGILASYEKTIAIRNMHRELERLRLIQLQKTRKLVRLKQDPGTIREYAQLYGLQGGEVVSPQKAADEIHISNVIHRLSAPEKGAFLLRHPILIVLVLLISLSLFAYFLVTRRQAVALKEEAPPRGRKNNGYINPSWG